LKSRDAQSPRACSISFDRCRLLRIKEASQRKRVFNLAPSAGIDDRDMAFLEALCPLKL
jgi:hypothetical protein